MKPTGTRGRYLTGTIFGVGLATAWALFFAAPHLDLESDPVGANVWIDGKLVGQTPIENHPLKRGTDSSVRIGSSGREDRDFVLSGLWIGSHRISISLPEETGELVVNSVPGGAWIHVDGKKRSEKTPTTLRLLPGFHEIRVSREGYEDSGPRTVQITREATRSISLRLNSRTGKLSVQTPGVPGARLQIDGGADRMVLPLEEWSLTAGSHLISIRAPGFHTYKETVQVLAGKTLSLHRELEPIRVPLRILSDPSESRMSLVRAGQTNWVRQGMTPAAFRVSPGLYRIQIEKAGYFSGSIQTQVLEPEETVRITLPRLWRERWNWVGSGSALISSPVAGDVDRNGKLEVVWIEENGRIQLVDGMTGKPRWQRDLGQRILATPTMTEVAGTGFLDVVVGAWDGNLYALSGRSGTPLWRYRGGARIAASTRAVELDGDGVLDHVFGDYKGRVHAVSGATGLPLWTGQLSGEIYAQTAALYGQSGTISGIVVGTLRGHLAVLSPETGRVLWEDRNVEGEVQASPTVGDVDGDGSPEILVSVTAAVSRLECYDSRTFKKRWSIPTAGAGPCSPVLVEGSRSLESLVYLGCRDGSIRAYAAREGTERWVFRARSSVMGGMALVDVTGNGVPDLIAVEDGGILHALEGRTGQKLWGIDVRESLYATPCSADLDADGTPEILLATQGSRGLCFSIEPTFERRAVHLGSQAGGGVLHADLDRNGLPEIVVGDESGRLTAYEVATERTLWRVRTGGVVGATPVAADVDADGDPDVICGSFDGKVYALEGSSGKILWKIDTGDAIYARASVGDLDGDGIPEIVVGSRDFHLYRLEGRTGKVLSRFATRGVLDGQVEILDLDGDSLPEVVVASGDGVLYALRLEEGQWKPLWTHPLGAVSSGGVCAFGKESDLLVVACKNGQVIAVDRIGKRRWTVQLDGRCYGAPSARDGKVWVGSTAGWVYQIDASGRILNRWNARGAVLGSVGLDEGKIAVGTREGQLSLFDLEGPKKWRGFQLGSSIPGPPLLGRFDGEDGPLQVAALTRSGRVDILRTQAPSLARSGSGIRTWRQAQRAGKISGGELGREENVTGAPRNRLDRSRLRRIARQGAMETLRKFEDRSLRLVALLALMTPQERLAFRHAPVPVVAAYALGDLDLTLRLLDRKEEQNPLSEDAPLALGAVLQAGGDSSRAMQVLSAAVPPEPHSGEGLENLRERVRGLIEIRASIARQDELGLCENLLRFWTLFDETDRTWASMSLEELSDEVRARILEQVTRLGGPLSLRGSLKKRVPGDR
ncbi:MAG: PQQ-binding-like beta-propeller repeat protein [Planctomycetota bacterium]|nr:PQQ-binding-like beta-propeller repeat protein [Planctomycetota bacterium]